MLREIGMIKWGKDIRIKIEITIKTIKKDKEMITKTHIDIQIESVNIEGMTITEGIDRAQMIIGKFTQLSIVLY